MATKTTQKEPLVSPEIQAIIDGKDSNDTPPASGNKRTLTPPALSAVKPKAAK